MTALITGLVCLLIGAVLGWLVGVRSMQRAYLAASRNQAERDLALKLAHRWQAGDNRELWLPADLLAALEQQLARAKTVAADASQGVEAT